MANLDLTRYFVGVIAKRLSEVEIVRQKSNQREFNSTQAMKVLLGDHRKTFDAQFIYLCDEMEPFTEKIAMTWYDARENNPSRSEFRLFYSGNGIATKSQIGDCLFLARKKDDKLLAVVTPKGSMMEKRMAWLFGIKPANMFASGDLSSSDDSCVAVACMLLRLLGVSDDETDDAVVSALRKKYVNIVPSFKEITVSARLLSGFTPEGLTADDALTGWMNYLEKTMRAAKKYLVSLSSSVMTKQKTAFQSLTGYINSDWQSEALFLYLKVLLNRRSLRYDEYRTSGKGMMILPGWQEKVRGTYSLGRISTVKTASLIDAASLSVPTDTREVYLLTLDPGITDEVIQIMTEKKIIPVVPSSIQKLYTVGNRFMFLSVEELLLVLSEKQEGRYGN